jgi:hypothetical protein
MAGSHALGARFAIDILMFELCSASRMRAECSWIIQEFFRRLVAGTAAAGAPA